MHCSTTRGEHRPDAALELESPSWRVFSSHEASSLPAEKLFVLQDLEVPEEQRPRAPGSGRSS